MGCVCCSVRLFVSTLLDALERVSMCTVCAALTCCLMCTIITVLIMGIGIGFHYCFVQTTIKGMVKPVTNKGIIPAVLSLEPHTFDKTGQRFSRREASNEYLKQLNNSVVDNIAVNNTLDKLQQKLQSDQILLKTSRLENPRKHHKTISSFLRKINNLTLVSYSLFYYYLAASS